MKTIIYIFFLTIFSLNINLIEAGATETSENGYDRLDFCKTKAQSLFESLNKLTENDVVEIEKLKRQINDLNAQKIIIQDVQVLRNDYVDNLGTIALKDDNKTTNVKTIENFKKLLRDALTLNAISLLTKSNLDSKNRPADIESLCENETNSKLTICQNYNPKNLNFFSGIGKNAEIKTINKSLENFSNAMNQVTDKEAMIKEIDKIYESIPKSLDPQIILEVLESKAPNLKAILMDAQTKNQVIKCLGNDNKSCESLISNPSNSKAVSVLIGEEAHALEGDLTDKYNQVKNQISSKYSTEFNNLLTHYQESPAAIKNMKAEDTKTLKKKLDELVKRNPRLERIEKLKQYIAERYVRSCHQANEANPATLISNISSIKCDFDTTDSSNNGNFEELSKSFSKILGRMQSENNISKTKGDNGIFSKDEINAYNNYCNDNIPDATMEEICKDIKEEQKKLSHVKDLNEWKKFNNKYIVETNPDTGRISYYEKKSGMSIFGEGLKQSFSSNAGRIFPMWLGNYQMQGQLDMMTDQAIYNKQMNYIYDPNSPWMNYNPYFQGSFYGTAEFTGFNNTAMPITNGFNFSK